MADLDDRLANRLAKLLGVAGSSAHQGEAVNAIQAADRLIRDAGLAWDDITAPFRELEVAKEAVVVLMAREQELLAEIARLRSGNGAGAGIVAWQDVGVAASSHQAGTRWMLELCEQRQIWLSIKERDFLGTISKWRGRLTSRQQPWFDEILARVCAQTGLRPQ